MDTSMRRESPGLYAGDIVRVEKVGSSWSTQVRARDVGSLIGKLTNIYEYHPDGVWTPVGSYRRLVDCQETAKRLVAGTHVVIGAHSTSSGKVPVAVVPSPVVNDEISRLTDEAGEDDCNGARGVAVCAVSRNL